MAVDPPLEVREQLVEWARGVAVAAREEGSARGSLRLLDAESLHLDAVLPGQPPGGGDRRAGRGARRGGRARMRAVGGGAAVAAAAPAARAGGRDPRSGGELARLQERVSGALAGVSGWRPERRRFRPHITLARVRGRVGGSRQAADRASARADRPGRELSLPATPRLSFTPEAIVLYRSWLAPEGANYEALASARPRRGLALSARGGSVFGFAGEAGAVGRGGRARLFARVRARRRAGEAFFFAFGFARDRFAFGWDGAEQALAVA